VEILLRLAPLCQGLLSFASQALMQTVTAEKIKAIVLARSSSTEGTQKNRMSSDEDEGEVRSDEEAAGKASGSVASESGLGVEEAVVEVLGVLGKEAAAQAISQLVQTYSCLVEVAQSQEEAMEEGEIVRTSLVSVVQEGCGAVLGRLLHRLQAVAMSHLTPGPRGLKPAGGDQEFAVGLKCGLQDWSKLIFHPKTDTRCREWLCAAVACVCVCAAELQTAQALATMLLHCQSPDHLGYVLSVYREASLRYPQLAQSAVSAALREQAEPRWLCYNLWRLTVGTEAMVEQEIRSDFTAAVRASLLPLSAWLCRLSSGERAEEAGRVLQVMREVGSLERSGGDYSTHCQVLANLLSTFFSCVACSCICESAVEVELVLSHCTKLLVRWVGPASKHSSKDALKIFVLTSLLKRAMSQDGGECASEDFPKVGGRPSQQEALLLLKPASRSSGSLPLPQQRPPQQSPGHLPHTNHILSLLEEVAAGGGDLVISVLLDKVAPHLPPDSAPWLPGEGPRSANLEWSLSVKQQFDRHPLLWHLLLFSAHSGCGFSQCEPIVCSLLLVLTQHWFSFRCSASVVATGRELRSSERLVECLAAAGWLTSPLCYCAELFRSISPHDLYMLMAAISNFIKENLPELRRGAIAQLKGVSLFSLHVATYNPLPPKTQPVGRC
jgi:hypothetical protein